MMSQPNVLLVILDAVRAKNMSLYNHHRETTPFLSKYAKESTVYTQARAPGIHSVASHASIWTGAEVEEHEIIRHGDFLDTEKTIWTNIGEKGYETGLFTKNTIVTHTSNLSEPFDHVCSDNYIDTESKLFENAYAPLDVKERAGIRGNIQRIITDDYPVQAFLNSSHHFIKKIYSNVRPDEVNSSDLIEDFLNWQDSCSGPWAACINLMDAHAPYEPQDIFDRWGGAELRAFQSEPTGSNAEEFISGRKWWKLEILEHLYDGAIRQVDSYVQDLIEELINQGIHDNTLVVIASDHGEGFGEISRLNNRTRMVDHSWSIHEVLTHVPLIVSYPHQSNNQTHDDVSTLTEFPRVVEKVIHSPGSRPKFNRRDRVYASTRRLLESDGHLFQTSPYDIKDYTGPWKAIYEGQDDNTIKRYTTHREDSAVVAIHNAQEHNLEEKHSDDVNEKVEREFDKLSDKKIKRTTQNEVPDQVEERLTDLGYI